MTLSKHASSDGRRGGRRIVIMRSTEAFKHCLEKKKSINQQEHRDMQAMLEEEERSASDKKHQHGVDSAASHRCTDMAWQKKNASDLTEPTSKMLAAL